LTSRLHPLQQPPKEAMQIMPVQRFANQPDNALHLASAALGLYFGLAGRRSVASAA
jgi:hypothetical protein